jgi:sugar/nucleoside kinase (ribokinase family)
VPPRVVVVGDLIFDMLARTEGEVAFGTDTFAPIRAAAGGSGANTAAWLASSGVETHFVGRVGDDVFGEALAGELKEIGVVAAKPSVPMTSPRPSFAEITCTSRATPSPATAAGRPP